MFSLAATIPTSRCSFSQYNGLANLPAFLIHSLTTKRSRFVGTGIEPFWTRNYYTFTTPVGCPRPLLPWAYTA